MERFPAAKEGSSRCCARSWSARGRSRRGRARSTSARLRVGRGADAAGERERDNVLADATEALVAPIYLDRGMPAARQIAAAIVAEPLARLDWARGDPRREERAAGARAVRGRRVAALSSGRQRRARTTVASSWSRSRRPGACWAQGRGRSKKLAEQAAARAAIEQEPRPSAGGDGWTTSCHLERPDDPPRPRPLRLLPRLRGRFAGVGGQLPGSRRPPARRGTPRGRHAPAPDE